MDDPNQYTSLPRTSGGSESGGASNVSVIVVSYNTRAKLRRCLQCIEPEHEVIVVDNASTDGSDEMVLTEFPHVRLIQNAENRGFGAANNQGMGAARRELVLFLNSDCYASPSAIAALATAFVHPEDATFGRGMQPPKHWKAGDPLNVVAAGGMLQNPDGSLQDSVASHLTLSAVASEQFFLEKLVPTYWITRRLYRESATAPRVVPQVMGACLMIKPLEQFDGRYFLYCEDTDLCVRLRRHGDVLWVPTARFIHELGSSSSGSERWRSVALYNRGKEIYFRKYHGLPAMVVCSLLNRLGALLRLLLWSIATVLTLGFVPRFRNQVWLFIRVLTAPLQGPRLPPRSAESPSLESHPPE